MPVLSIALVIYLLMLPVTGMVPVLSALTAERYPETGDLARHAFMSMNMIGALLAAPCAGWLSDRLGRRRAIIIGALVLNALTLLLIAGPWPYPIMLTVRFIEGCAHMSALSLLMTLGAEHARRNGLAPVMGGIGAAISLGVASGAPLGGWVGSYGAELVPLAGGVLMLALVPAAWLLLREAPATARTTGSPFAALRQQKMLLVPYVFSFVDRLTVGFIVSTFSLYLASVIGLEPARIGVVMAAFLIPFSLLTWPAGWLCRHVDRFAMLLIGSLLYGIFLIVLGYTPAHGLIPVMALGGVVAALMYAPTLILTAELAPTGHRAITMAGFNVAGSAGFACGPLLSGMLVAYSRSIGLDPYLLVFTVIAAIEILITMALLPLWLKRRRLRKSGSSFCPDSR